MNDYVWTTLPAKQSLIPVDLMDPGKCPLEGAFCLDTNTSAGVRKLLVYIPEAWNNNDPVLVIAPPSDRSAEQFLSESGLCEFTQKRGVMAAILVRDADRTIEEDAEFMNAAYKKLQGREYFVTMQDCFYAMGFGNGSSAAMKAMLSMGSDWSGAAFFGGITDVTSESVCTDADQGSQSGEMYISGKSAQLPVWLLEETETPDLTRIRDYWIRKNNDLPTPLFDDRQTAVYRPKPLSRISSINDAPISEVRVTLGFRPEQLDAGMLDYIWSYIGAARRHRSYGNKILRYYRDPKREENGAEYHQMVIDGMMREWYEYVPDRFRQSKIPLPVVVVFHGRGGNGQSFFDITDMSLVAEERGFIALFPTADIYQIRPDGYRGVRLWNGNYNGTDIDSMPFVRAMLKDTAKRHPVDRSRIYACGQSSGGYMTTCCAFQADDLFAAVAPWSGYTFPGTRVLRLPKSFHGDLNQVPIYLLVGKKDQIFGAPSINLSAPTYDLEHFILYVLDCYGLSKEFDSYECYPIQYYVWKKAGVPMLTLGLVDDMPHANYAEESRISYDDFMCRFSKDSEGKRYYMGKKI